MTELNKQRGFTVMELIIASTIFALILLLVTFGLLQIGNAFTKSVNEAKVREATRLISEDIVKSIRFGGSNVDFPIQTNSGTAGFCVGNKRYSYIKDRHVNGNHGLVVDVLDGCNSSSLAQNINNPASLTPGSIELLSDRMRLDYIDISPVGTGEGYFSVTVRILVYSNDFDIEDDPTIPGSEIFRCKGNLAGTHYCAVSELTTLAQKRLD